MRVLSVGNMYPPHHLGGYELTWRSAVAHQRRRGDEVRVLTTDFRSPAPDRGITEDEGVFRELRWYWRDHDFPRMGIAERRRLERHNIGVLGRHLQAFEPQVVTWWAMGGMSLSLIEHVRRQGLPAVGVVGDDWMRYGPGVDGWQRAFGGRGPLSRIVELATGIPTGVDLARAGTWLFGSESLRRWARDAGWRLDRTAIVHAGIDSGLFRLAPEKPWRGRLLYVGRIDSRKGTATAVAALSDLPDMSLRVIGSGDEAHLRELRRLAREAGADDRVTFDRLPRDRVAAAYAEADALLFPVLWEEPWGLVPLEAMAVGTPVIATGAGGSSEYLEDGVNCLIFTPRGDPAALAAAVCRLAGDPGLRRALRSAGSATAGRFTEAAFNQAVAATVAEAVAA
jgi:glycogen synthase